MGTSTYMKNHRTEKEKTLGQFFTKESIIEKLLNLLFTYKKYDNSIKILEPSFGTGNFIKVLGDRDFRNIDACEIDPELTKEPKDFFDYPLQKKYDLIIGNPPFTKYNLPGSYYYQKNYANKSPNPVEYLPKGLFKKEKEKIENVFILKAIKHLSGRDATIAFILPISFFIKNKNKIIKAELLSHFSTIIIFQNKEIWFNYNIPCCFAIFTHTETYKNKIILYYENEKEHKEIIGIDNIYEELIPEVHHNKKYGLTNNHNGDLLKRYLNSSKVQYHKSVSGYNVSGKNILEKTTIPPHKSVKDYKMAVVRVGNASVGRCGLIDVRHDTLNDMFYVFDFASKYSSSKKIKEKICREINKNQDYFKSITCRVGSKSIKKEDIYNFKVSLQ